MMFATLALAFAASAAAIQVTAPSNTTGWTSTGAQVIEWDSVSTDPSNFTIQLIDPSSPNSPVELAMNVLTSDETYTYTPSSDLQEGGQWRINFVQERSDGGQQILAQSEYFDVEAGTSTVSASASASSSSAAASASSQSASQSISQSASASASSGAAQSSGNGAESLVLPGGILMFLAGAVGVLA